MLIYLSLLPARTRRRFCANGMRDYKNLRWRVRAAEYFCANGGVALRGRALFFIGRIVGFTIARVARVFSY